MLNFVLIPEPVGIAAHQWAKDNNINWITIGWTVVEQELYYQFFFPENSTDMTVFALRWANANN